jgi:hypothetical protein
LDGTEEGKRSRLAAATSTSRRKVNGSTTQGFNLRGLFVALAFLPIEARGHIGNTEQKFKTAYLDEKYSIEELEGKFSQWEV